MADKRFFKINGPLSLKEICTLTGAVPDETTQARFDDNQPIIRGIAALVSAGEGQITYLSDKKLLPRLEKCGATACFVKDLPDKTPDRMAFLLTPSPELAFARVARTFFNIAVEPGIHPAAIIDPDADISDGCRVEAGAVIGAHVALGTGCHIKANATIGDHVQIGRDCVIGNNASVSYSLLGDRVFIHDGARIGDEGFRFVPGENGPVKVPQVGRVIIQDDVEIGSNSTVDRGALDDTVIGAGTKIDNLVQVGHNCKIGRFCLIAGHVGISGSVTLGDFVTLGGQVGIADHVAVAPGVQIAAKGGVPSDIDRAGTYGGFPVKPIREWGREVAAIKKLARKGTSRGSGKASSEKQQDSE